MTKTTPKVIYLGASFTLVCVYNVVALLLLVSRSEATSVRSTGTAGYCITELGTDSGRTFPILFTKSGEQIFPNITSGSDRAVVIPENQNITVACPGDNNEVASCSTPSTEATCNNGKLTPHSNCNETLIVNCSLPVIESVIRSSKKCGPGRNLTMALIGWQVGHKFYNQIEICHDETVGKTTFTKHLLHGSSIVAKDKDKGRPSFKKGDFFGKIPVYSVYGQSYQLKTFITLFGSKELAQKYLDVSKNYYFARGHLAPDGDFVYLTWQDSTYYYINVAPQWQSFNNGNWKALEDAVRRYAARMDTKVTVYTGTHDTLSLPDINNNDIDVYLYIKRNQTKIPVPKFYWKVIHNHKKNSAIAFVGVNNPHLTSIPEDYKLCPDICDVLSWITWDRTDIPKGYLYCCNVRALRESVPQVPFLRVKQMND